MLAKGQDNARLRFSLGNAYFKEKNFPLAVAHFAKAVAYELNYSAVWRSYGKALAENQQLQEAMAIYTKGIEVAERTGNIQATKEMKVFLKRLQKH